MSSRKRSPGAHSGDAASAVRWELDGYLSTPDGLWAQHWQRVRRRVCFSVDGVEPRSRDKMRDADKDEVQRQLLSGLIAARRRAFRGPVALKLTLGTTGRNPNYPHHITKNLLDLFGRPRPALATSRRGLLYADDSQIHALSVSCRHGEPVPAISGEATALGSLLADIDLAMRAPNRFEREDRPSVRRLDDAIKGVRELLGQERDYRSEGFGQVFEVLLHHARREAQECLLSQATITPYDLWAMFGAQSTGSSDAIADTWERTFASAPLRVMLDELPQVDGASKLYKEKVEEELRAFQERFGWLIDPLLVPVALEVVVKPPPPGRKRGLHDLDNVLSKYLIPKVKDVLKPISHFAWTRDDAATAPEKRLPGTEWLYTRPPPSTRIGVIRYDAWRLPPAVEGGRGFVGVAVVADSTGLGGALSRIEDDIWRWKDAID